MTMTTRADIAVFALNWIVESGGPASQETATLGAAGLDSLDLIEFSMDLEEKFQVDLAAVDLDLDMTVARIVNEVETRLT